MKENQSQLQLMNQIVGLKSMVNPLSKLGGGLTWSLLEYLATHPQEPLYPAEITRIVTENELGFHQSGSKAISILRKTLRDRDHQLILSYGPKNNTNTHYLFNADVQWKKSSQPAEQPNLQAEKMRVNPLTRETETKGQVYQLKESNTWEILKYLAYHPRERVSRLILEEVLIAASENIPGKYSVAEAIHGLRRLFEENPRKPQLFRRYGTNNTGGYLLNADVEILDQTELTKKKEFEVTLPDGKIFQTNGEIENKCLNALIHTNKNSTIEKQALEEITDSLPDPESRKASDAIWRINNKLRSLGWQVAA